ncbi:MAG: MBL fold metallo-hydrolase [Rhodospirillales bacterium]|nr:MBL fold metallo-hydrolase [Rhodospirillales bacterium]
MNIFKIISTFIVVIVAVFAIAATAPATSAEKSDFSVTLLGTGTPPPLMTRFGPATLVQVNGKALLFDVGRGATQRLWEKKVPLGKIDHVFLTHLHSDHVVGIPDLMLTGWLTSPFGRRKGQFHINGPKGTKNLMSHLRQAYDWDIQTRINDQGFKETGVIPNVKEVYDGYVWNEDGIKVTAFKVNHGKKIDPAFGYRIDFDGRSVVISGDTKPDDNLVKNAQGADLFIHSVAAIKQELRDSAKHWNIIMDHHSEPEDAGKTFAQTRPKMATYSHIVLLTNGKIKPPSFEDLTTRTRTEYDGPFVVGQDLMSFDIGKNGVTVNQSPGQ